MARPYKTVSELRNELIQVRVTLAEKLVFEQKAQEADLSTSDFLRALIKAKRIRQPMLSVYDREAGARLIRIDTNLNQIAKHLNSGGFVDPVAAQQIEEIHAAVHELRGRMIRRMDELGMFDGL
jgi:hypothetical protein